jgi:hypothetical protein
LIRQFGGKVFSDYTSSLRKRSSTITPEPGFPFLRE